MERMKKIGRIQPANAKEIGPSRLGIGFEKLDRKAFDPNKAYDKVAELGVYYVRLQSGWQRTEREKGVYDFTWLDEIVDNILARGQEPWINLCYGNDLYNADARKYYGAVGCAPIFPMRRKERGRIMLKLAYGVIVVKFAGMKYGTSRTDNGVGSTVPMRQNMVILPSPQLMRSIAQIHRPRQLEVYCASFRCHSLR